MKHKQSVHANQSSGCQIECMYLQISIDFTALHLNILDLFKPELFRIEPAASKHEAQPVAACETSG